MAIRLETEMRSAPELDRRFYGVLVEMLEGR
jgi:hypothetical protein